MTCIAIWINGEMPSPNIWAVADSRISTIGSRNEQVPLLNEASKLFGLPISCRTVAAGGGFFDQLYFSHSIGLAYAGSSLVALNLYLALVPLLSNLGSIQKEIPKLDEIAQFVAELLRRLTISRNQNSSERAIAEAAVFGYCHAGSRLRVFHLVPSFTPEFAVRVEEADYGCEESVLLLGDKKAELEQAIASERSGKQSGTLPWWRAPKKVISEIIENGIYSSIGGSLQLGIADIRGFVPHTVAATSPKGRPPGTLKYLGLDVFDELGQVGKCFVNMPGMS